MENLNLSKIPTELGLRVIRPYLEQFEAELFAEFAKEARIEGEKRRQYQC